MGKTVLVTGGSGEIGSAICKKFAANGFDVIITYNSNSERAERLIQALSPGNHMAIKAPTTDADAILELKKVVQKQYGCLDVLVNNAGITTPVDHKDLEGLTDAWIDKIMQTNFRGSFAMARAFKDLLVNSDEQTAVIVNISSIAGIFGIGSNVAYCASKAALDSMTRSLARALAPKIRVVSVSPGFVEGEYTANIDSKFLKEQRDKTPLGHFAMGNDVAKAVFSVVTQLTFSTGNIITVDGGRLL
ncbi:SDR family NAD(P)-dependent oxidoreductase [Allomuricauda sp. NBRC 101325]|uniref:SDR family NAD(P)-dependent oxidoreductase n=1 Tax=Allomuricauda sp. NBRC 101325 TaxID=1113758 RepID=UPI0024A466E8|nr:SDR family oxidoreductase [Muricauda sp. NBRC 101325]GLU45185.1 3-oxoacyl-ACP reductase [Muricauda sp. NBRC 101325]